MDKIIRNAATVTAANFEEHIRRVEEFLAYEDPPSVLLRGLAERVKATGFGSLTTAEQHYCALHVFTEMLFNFSIVDFFEDQDDEIQDAVRSGLDVLGTPEMVARYEQWRKKHQAGEMPEDDEELMMLTDSFIEECTVPEDILDRYAIDHGLLSE